MDKKKKKNEAGTLELHNIVKTFAGHDQESTVTAVDHVSLTINRGEFVTLLGPSGCGKTTTLRLIAGFEMPNTGTITLDNEDITFDAPNKRDMAMVFQSYALFPHLSVYDNVAYGLKVRRMGQKDYSGTSRVSFRSSWLNWHVRSSSE